MFKYILKRALKNNNKFIDQFFGFKLYVSMICAFLVLALDINYIRAQTPVARNVILMIADGWGEKQIEAANKYTGTTPLYQTSTDWTQYWMSTYPIGGSYDTTQAWTNFQYVLQNAVTDSAAAASALYTGSKTDVGNISVSTGDASRLFAIGEKSKQLIKAVGSVSSVAVSHGTPGAWTSHNDVRSNGYAIADEAFFGDPNTTGLASDPLYGGGHGVTLPVADVVIGSSGSAYINSAISTKLGNESGQAGKHVLVERQTGVDGGTALLNAANNASTTKLAGLFGGHIFRLADGSNFNSDRPTLSDCALAALTVLNRNASGFVLMIEGGAVDWAGHANNMDQLVGEMIDFNDAVQAVIDWIDDPANGSDWDDTLLIVTGDHETGYLTPDTGIFPNLPLGTVNDTTIGLEKVYSGSGGRRASWDDLDNDSVIDAGEVVYWAWNTGSHSNSLIPLYTRGVGSNLFANYSTNNDTVRGTYLDNTNVFNVMNTVFDNLIPIANDDIAFTGVETLVVIDVVSNDEDLDGGIDPASVVVSVPGNGSAVANANGTVDYTPDPGFIGSDQFTYTVNDTLGTTSNVANVTINVGQILFSDDFSSDTTANYTVVEVWGSGSSFVYDSIGDRAQVISGDNLGLQFSNSLTATDDGVFGIDFLPTVKYPLGGWIEIRLIQDANNYYELSNSDGYGPYQMKKFVGGVEVENVPFTNGFVQNTNYSMIINFSPTLTTVNAFGDELTLNTDTTSILINSFEVEINQQEAYFDNIFLTSGSSANLPPVAVDDIATTPLDIPVIIDVVANDTDSDGSVDPATVAIVDDVPNGSTAVIGDGTVTYTPNVGFVGADIFTYTVMDNLGLISNIGTVTVHAGNDPPVATDDDANTIKETQVIIDVIDNDSDDGVIDPTTVTIVDFPVGGIQADPNPDGTVTYTPEFGFTGIDTFTYTVKDTLGAISNTATVNVTVTLQNSAPTLSVSEPNGVGDTVTVGDLYDITYDLGDAEDTVTAAFFHDADNTGLDGTAITGACASAIEGTGVTCSWDTTGMSPGTYYVYGLTDDGTNPQVSAYSSGVITINAVGNSAPTLSVSEPNGVGDTVTVGDLYDITYDLGDAEDTVTAAFFYDADNTGLDGTAIIGACASAAEGTGVTCSWDTTGMSPGTYYVYGLTDDGTNPQVSAYSPGTIVINASASLFSDNFDTDTTGNYTVVEVWGSGSSFAYDSIGNRAQVGTGDNMGIQFSHSLSATDNGSFSIDFLPTTKYPFGGWVEIRLIQDANNYYEMSNSDGYGPYQMKKIVGGVEVENVPFINGFVQNTNYTITIDFSPNLTTVNAFGDLLTLNTDTTSILINNLEVETNQQDAFFDNILLTTGNSLPTLNITEPNGISDTITVGDLYDITYDLGDAEETVTAAFFYDADNTGLDGTAIIGACASAIEGTGVTCSWDTTGMLPGTYYVYGLTDDGTNPQISAYSSGVITINSVGNAAPTLSVSEPNGVGDTITVGDLYNITYDLGDAEDTVTAAFFYDADNTGLDGTAIIGACASAVEGTGVTCSWDTAGMLPGTYYVYGLTDDGTNPQVSAYSPGTIVINALFSDNFDTDTTGNYTVVDVWGAGSSFAYDSIGNRAQVGTGDNMGIQFSHSLPAADNGSFSIDFLPTTKYPFGGWVEIRLIQDANNYYEMSNSDGYGPYQMKKIVGGVEVENVPFVNGFVQNTNYTITIDFSPNLTTVNAFGNELTLNTDTTSILINNFEVETNQQDAYYDNILYQ